MRHPWFNLRLAIAGAFLMLWYLPPLLVGAHFGAPLWLLVLGLLVVLWAEYVIGVKRAIRSVNAEHVTGETPGEREFLNRIRTHADALGVPMPTVSVGELGAPNAFAVGRKGNGHIVFSKTLVALLPPEELEAVAVHELSHLRSRDAIPMEIGQGSAGIAYFLVAVVASLFDSGPTHHSRGGSLSTLAGTAAHMVVLLSVFAIARQREFVADYDAKQALGTGEPLARALERISQFNREHHTPEPPEAVESLCIASEWSFHGLASTHPSTTKRLARLRE